MTLPGGGVPIHNIDQYLPDTPAGVPMIGTYLLPRRLLADRFTVQETAAAVEVVLVVALNGLEVSLTRASGLFVPVPDHFGGPGDERRFDTPFAARWRFTEEAVGACNQLVCALALDGLVFQPVTPIHLVGGRRVGDRAHIKGGGQQYYSAIQTALDFQYGTWWLLWDYQRLPRIDPTIVAQEAAELLALSAQSPLFIAAAYSAYVQRQYNEARIHSWIVIEQYVSRLWLTFVSSLNPSKRRRDKLEDHNAYTTAVQAEFLLAAGCLEEELFAVIEPARDARNKLMHRTLVTEQAATTGMVALQGVLKKMLGRPVYRPTLTQVISW